MNGVVLPPWWPVDDPTLGGVDPDKVRALRRVVGTVKRSTAERDRLIVELHRDGASLRAIAKIAGLSHAGVQRVIDRRPDAD